MRMVFNGLTKDVSGMVKGRGGRQYSHGQDRVWNGRTI